MAKFSNKSKKLYFWPNFPIRGVKMWKLTSNFPNRKTFWHVKGMNIPSDKMSGYKHGGVWYRVFMMS